MEIGTMTSPAARTAETKRDSITDTTVRTSLIAARAATDKLFGLVRRPALYDRPIRERHRLIFYLGHLEAFDWNLLGVFKFGLDALHPEFDRLFAFGIDPTRGDLPEDQPQDWPGVEEVLRYGATARERIDLSLDKEIDRQLVSVAIEHRLMHAETLAYLMHALPFSAKNPPRRQSTHADSRPIDNRMIEVTAGIATLGTPPDENSFAWDNEFDEHQAHVPAFAIERYKVTNLEFMAFVSAGGYEIPSLWSRDGWEWIQREGIRYPRFWSPHGDSWNLRTVFSEIPLQANWPAYVSYAEAEAYARWRGRQLPTEAQFHRAAYGIPFSSDERRYPWGNDKPQGKYGNFDGEAWDPMPVDAHPLGESGFGVSGLLGNGWEWTRTPFAPFPGFRPFDFYKGYSADFFDNRHYVLKGGSARTASTFLRRSFRNWFQPFYPNIYAGFRCIED
jgi:ergothioneine biosynthesis protein EgtB